MNDSEQTSVMTKLELIHRSNPSFSAIKIPPEEFNRNYNIDISPYVERHIAKENAQKGSNKAIRYISYSHALRLFREAYPGWSVNVLRNPDTGGVLFVEEVELGGELLELGYYIISYISDEQGNRSEFYYNALLTMSGQAIVPGDVKTTYGSGAAKKLGNGKNAQLVDSQLINKQFYRAMVKAIALCTGIGLKLWTGDDLSEEIIDSRLEWLKKVQGVYAQYKNITGDTLEAAEKIDSYNTEEEIRAVGRTIQELLNQFKQENTAPKPVEESVKSNSEEPVDSSEDVTGTKTKRQTKKTTTKKQEVTE